MINLEREEKIKLPDGCEFIDSNGNFIETSEIMIRKKPKVPNTYPKTYEECCEIMKCAKDIFFTTYDSDCMENDGGYLYKQIGELTTLLKLKICRDVYWHIANWTPNWDSLEKKYTIYNYRGKISNDNFTMCDRSLLVFPTEGMRDAFYDNFEKEIYLCREYL